MVFHGVAQEARCSLIPLEEECGHKTASVCGSMQRRMGRVSFKHKPLTAANSCSCHPAATGILATLKQAGSGMCRGALPAYM